MLNQLIYTRINEFIQRKFMLIKHKIYTMHDNSYIKYILCPLTAHRKNTIKSTLRSIGHYNLKNCIMHNLSVRSNL